MRAEDATSAHAPLAPIERNALSLWERFVHLPLASEIDLQLASRRVERISEYLNDPSHEIIRTRHPTLQQDSKSLMWVLGSDSEAPSTLSGHSIAPSLRLNRKGSTEASPLPNYPFVDILGGVTERALAEVREELEGSVKEAISKDALKDLALALLGELSSISQHALMTELHLERSRGGAEATLSRLLESPKNSVYEAFITRITQDNGSAFYARYPVIYRLFSIRLSTWRTNVASLLRALHRDRKDLFKHFGVPKRAIVTRIDYLLSDPHDGGKTVARLSFNSGHRIMFKPRSLALDEGFRRLLEHLNSASPIQLFRAPLTITRRQHGWAECIEHSQVTTVEEAALYFRRAGALLAVLHALRGTDCHNENIIASDNFPILVDMETLFHPSYGLYRAGFRDVRMDSSLFESVCRIGMLPPPPDNDGTPDISALGALQSDTTALCRVFENVGTSLMTWRDAQVPRGSQPNIPSTLEVSKTRIIT